jgi:uncharacterized protein YceK
MKRFGAIVLVFLVLALFAGCSSTVSMKEVKPDGTVVTTEGPANFFLAGKQFGALQTMARLQSQGAFSHTVRYGGNMASGSTRPVSGIPTQYYYQPPPGYKLVPDTAKSAYQSRVFQPQESDYIESSPAVFKSMPASRYRTVALEPEPKPLPPAYQASMPELTVTSPNPFVAQYMAQLSNFSRYREKSGAEIWAMLGGKTVDGIVRLGSTFIPWYYGAQIAGDLLDNLGPQVNTGGGDAIVGDGNNWTQWNVNSSGDYSPWAIQQGQDARFMYNYKPDNSSEAPVTVVPPVIAP